MAQARTPEEDRPKAASAPPDEHAGSRAGGRAQPWWEWLVAGAGGILLLGTIGDLVYQGTIPAAGPPAVSLSVVRIEPLPQHGFVAIVRATNRGGQTAAGLKIEGELRRPGAPAETREFTLDYLPAGSSREGGLFFAQDPRSPDADLVLRPSGYNKP
jgi:uncharacterized protein (TIGR02588 family)